MFLWRKQVNIAQNRAVWIRAVLINRFIFGPNAANMEQTRHNIHLRLVRWRAMKTFHVKVLSDWSDDGPWKCSMLKRYEFHVKEMKGK